jgi:hypothetical protein
MIALFCAVAFGSAAFAQVGEVERAQGLCHGTTGDSTVSLAPGAPIEFEQIVSTEAGARLELGFVDQTTLTLGENARLRIDRFVYAPQMTRTSIRLAAVGAFRFVSGARSAGSDVSVATPVATIGVRGTDFWAGPIDGAYGVLLLDGVVDVVNGSGSATLDEPGEGVNIAGPDAAPGAVTQWPQDKVSRALAAVAFQ